MATDRHLGTAAILEWRAVARNHCVSWALLFYLWSLRKRNGTCLISCVRQWQRDVVKLLLFLCRLLGLPLRNTWFCDVLLFMSKFHYLYLAQTLLKTICWASLRLVGDKLRTSRQQKLLKLVADLLALSIWSATNRRFCHVSDNCQTFFCSKRVGDFVKIEVMEFRLYHVYDTSRHIFCSCMSAFMTGVISDEIVFFTSVFIIVVQQHQQNVNKCSLNYFLSNEKWHCERSKQKTKRTFLTWNNTETRSFYGHNSRTQSG